MQGIGVIGIDRQGLLAANLRVEIPAGLSMAQAGLMERGGRVGACTRWFNLGSLPSGPAFATIHQRISGDSITKL
jgi:hypothetical protein